MPAGAQADAAQRQPPDLATFLCYSLAPSPASLSPVAPFPFLFGFIQVSPVLVLFGQELLCLGSFFSTST